MHFVVNTPITTKFPFGQVVATQGAAALLERETQTANEFLERHGKGDWGKLSEHDRKMNDQGLANGDDRLMSVYDTKSGEKLWIITEWDRSVTTLLLPTEY